MKALTEKQKTILDYIQQERSQNGIIPSYRKIMRAMGYASVSTVAAHMAALHKKGHLEPQKTPDSTITYLPLIGHFTDGKPLEISASLETQIPIHLPETTHSCYALRVRGDELISDAILDGDILIIEARSEIETGEVALTQTEYGLILRKIDFQGPHLRLSRIRDPGSGQVVPQDEVTIQAVILQVLRQLTL